MQSLMVFREFSKKNTLSFFQLKDFYFLFPRIFFQRKAYLSSCRSKRSLRKLGFGAERRKGEWDNGRGQQAAAAKSPCKPSSQLAGFKSLNAQNCLRTFTFRYKIKLKNNISFIISTKIMIYTFIQAEKCIFFHYEFPPIFEKIRLFINRLDTLDSRTIL